MSLQDWLVRNQSSAFDGQPEVDTCPKNLQKTADRLGGASSVIWLRTIFLLEVVFHCQGGDIFLGEKFIFRREGKEKVIESRSSSCRERKSYLERRESKEKKVTGDESGRRRDWSEFHVHLDSYASLSLSRFGLFCIARLVDF